MGHRDVNDGSGPVSRCHREAGDRTIRDYMNMSLEIPKNGDSQSHMLDDTFHIPDSHGIADTVLIFEQNEES